MLFKLPILVDRLNGSVRRVVLYEMSDLQVQLCQAVMSLSQGPSSTPAHACQLEQRVGREYSRQT
ncbi:MAG: hypothetical protein HOA25_14535 [Gammaproteobacteria bacterium]|nr:hypothetical protein [Gammaproteobacteria bacterium]